MEMDRIACVLLTHQVITNPLPWRISWDWSWQVLAYNGVTIAKTKNHSEAVEIVNLAEGIQKEIDAAHKKIVPGD